MRRRTALAGIAIVVLVATACTAGTGNVRSSQQPQPVGVPCTRHPHALELLHRPGVQAVQPGPRTVHAAVPVDHRQPRRAASRPQDILRAINSGTAPDVAIEAGPDDVAQVLQHAAPTSTSTRTSRRTASTSPRSSRRRRCSTPATRATSARCRCCPTRTASTTTTTCSQTAGITTPPEDASPSWTTDAKKLTTYNPDGSIKVAGFVPLQDFYENPAARPGRLQRRASGTRATGKSALATDPKWAQLLTWQK